jgi:hypothetical protein
MIESILSTIIGIGSLQHRFSVVHNETERSLNSPLLHSTDVSIFEKWEKKQLHTSYRKCETEREKEKNIITLRKKKDIDRQRNREGHTLWESKRKRDRQTYRHTDRHAYV